ncbi:hypothetical protein DFH27DRAFT_539600 [Peziza echinospora]|nr:hypothetical protein DFH27DRAFT_539600 [Peziza echinospora]
MGSMYSPRALFELSASLMLLAVGSMFRTDLFKPSSHQFSAFLSNEAVFLITLCIMYSLDYHEKTTTYIFVQPQIYKSVINTS